MLIVNAVPQSVSLNDSICQLLHQIQSLPTRVVPMSKNPGSSVQYYPLQENKLHIFWTVNNLVQAKAKV